MTAACVTYQLNDKGTHSATKSPFDKLALTGDHYSTVRQADSMTVYLVPPFQRYNVAQYWPTVSFRSIVNVENVWIVFGTPLNGSFGPFNDTPGPWMCTFPTQFGPKEVDQDMRVTHCPVVRCFVWEV